MRERKIVSEDDQEIRFEKEVVAEKNILRLANPSAVYTRTKSVLNPTAQSVKLCVEDKVPQGQEEQYLDYLEKVPAGKYTLKMIIELLQNGGLRVSEALAVRGTDVLVSGHILIKGCKGSSDRIVQVYETRKYFLAVRGLAVNVFEGCSRYWVYREFKKLGIGKRFDGKRKESVTHYFRQQNARMMQESGISDINRQQHLGHKSNKSIKHYSNEKTK